MGNNVYEWIQAAHYDNLSLDEFMEKPIHYKEMIIAAYRMSAKIEAVITADIKKGK